MHTSWFLPFTRLSLPVAKTFLYKAQSHCWTLFSFIPFTSHSSSFSSSLLLLLKWNQAPSNTEVKPKKKSSPRVYCLILRSTVKSSENVECLMWMLCWLTYPPWQSMQIYSWCRWSLVGRYPQLAPPPPPPAPTHDCRPPVLPILLWMLSWGLVEPSWLTLTSDPAWLVSDLPLKKWSQVNLLQNAGISVEATSKMKNNWIWTTNLFCLFLRGMSK